LGMTGKVKLFLNASIRSLKVFRAFKFPNNDFMTENIIKGDTLL